MPHDLGSTHDDDRNDDNSYDHYEIDDAASRIDRDVAWAFLSTEAYWGRWRTRADFEAQVDNAWRVAGAYRRDSGAMVGFARATSDGVAYAYLADVFVLPPARGRGVAQRIVTELVDLPPADTFRWSLHTADAHGLYRKCGFAPPDGTYLERRSPR